MEQVGTQIKLPLSRAIQISVQGIRIRMGRSLVTLSGVVLGIAFLMSNLSSQLIKQSMAHETEIRQSVTLMENLLKGEVGTLQGKVIAVAAFGTLSEEERGLVARLAKDELRELRGFGFAAEGVKSAEAASLGKNASLVIVLGNQHSSSSLAELTAGMNDKIVFDSLESRSYQGGEDAGVKREMFFGKEAADRAEKLRKETESNRFRTIWITVFSLLVTVIGIANALLMSVTERFREIGTMKCLGALSAFIRHLFLIESTIIGLTGSIVGTILGALLPLLAYGGTYGFVAVAGAISFSTLGSYALLCMVAGTFLSMIAAIYPANFASRMVPASALRSNV